MSTINQVLERIDLFLKAPIAGADYIFRYGLAPMYRSIHRRKPRALLTRAIRWIQPTRYFQLMNLTADDFKKMGVEELRKTIIGIHEYRKEALTISNRYDQMISLIERGQTPYRIMWPEKRWLTLAERMDRAQRLKKGTSEWEKKIDKKAFELRTAMLEKGLKLEDVKEIWEPIPAFRDPKKKYRPLRTTQKPLEEPISREITDRGEKFRLPAPEEYRPGEQLLGHRMHEGHLEPISLGEYVVRGPTHAEFVAIQQMKALRREKLAAIPKDNWSHGTKKWNPRNIKKVAGAPTKAKIAKEVKVIEFDEDGEKERAIAIIPLRPSSVDAVRNTYLLDRGLGLKVTPRVERMKVGPKDGYLAEQVNGVSVDNVSDESWNVTLANRRARESLYGIQLLDILTGHPGRLETTIEYDPSHRAFFAIDNERAFRMGVDKEIIKGGVIDRLHIRQFPDFEGKKGEYQKEMEEYYDAHVTPQKLGGIIKKYNLTVTNFDKKMTVLKKAFVFVGLRSIGGHKK